MGIRYYTATRNIRFKSLSSRHIHTHSLSGQTLVEYALILAFISVVAIVSLISMGGQVSTVYTGVNKQLTTAELGGSAPARSH